MLKSHFLTAIRTLLRYKEYSLINIFGLTISIGACLFLFLVLRFELSFDTYHKNASSVYRVVMDYRYPEGSINTPGIPAPAPVAFRTDFPQLKRIATILSVPNVQINILKEDKKGLESKYREDKGVFFAEPEFFSILDFKWLHGSPETSLKEPNMAVLSEEIAAKYFGSWQNAIGKVIQYRNEFELKVSGIIENVPANSDFPLAVVISFNTRKESDLSWGNVTSRRQCYIQLPEKVTASQIENLFPAFEKKYFNSDDVPGHFVLQPLSSIHFDERYGTLNGRTISKSTLLSISLMGIFLLITASINFINLAIAQVIRKAKEIGVRKVLGSSRRQITLQFFGETFIILIIASGIAVVLTQVTLPFLRPVLNLPLNYNPISPLETFIFLGALIIILTLLSGIYPAVLMSGFKPIQALKSKINNQKIGGLSLRKGLVVVQFVIAQILVTVTMVIFLQLDYFTSAPMGFDKDAIIFFSIPSDSASQLKIDPFKNTLQQIPGITNFSFSFSAPAWRSNRTSNFRFDQSQKDEPFEVNMKYADVDFFKTYNIQIIAGRVYQPSDTSREYVVNEAFLKKFGIKDPQEGIGKTITTSGVTLPIVGVMRDFHNRSLHSLIEPLALSDNKSEYHIVGMKVRPEHIQEIVKNVSALYNTFYPSNIFEYQFLDETLEKSYQQEKRLSTLTNIISGIAIFISCLGLYGLISFMAVQRTKEVGIRKVLGATVPDILYLFGKEFILLVMIAFIIASPIAGYLMEKWLSGFAFHINLNVWLFIISMLGTMLIAIITLSFQSIKAAIANPVDSLRNE